MNIPLLVDDRSHDACNRYYRRALLNTLLYLKPKHCLEIGTYNFASSYVFATYFQTAMDDGKLITADISMWTRDVNTPYNTYPLMVYPHSTDVVDRHGDISIYLPGWKQKCPHSVQLNGNIINRKMDEVGIDSFQFFFCDGDHSKDSFYSDLYIALPLMDPDGWLLLDDVFDKRCESSEAYKELCKKNKFYEYDDWEINPGMALIQCKELKL